MPPESDPLTQPNISAYPSASATDTSLNRSVDSRTILSRALTLLCWFNVIGGCCGVGACEWPSCARARQGQTVTSTRAIMEYWSRLANRRIFKVKPPRHGLLRNKISYRPFSGLGVNRRFSGSSAAMHGAQHAFVFAVPVDEMGRGQSLG